VTTNARFWYGEGNCGGWIMAQTDAATATASTNCAQVHVVTAAVAGIDPRLNTRAGGPRDVRVPQSKSCTVCAATTRTLAAAPPSPAVE
jgi:hypothetical protein